MSGYRAFGEAANRDALIADIRARGPIAQRWLTRAAIEGDIGFVSDDHGLHPALARLLPALGGFGEAEDTSEFYAALLTAIPVGADTGRLAREALLLAWTDPDYGRAQRVERGPAYDACGEIADLVMRSIDHPVDKKAWRGVRGTLVAACHGDSGADGAADLMMSLAWDLDHAPGAAHDVMTIWAAAVSREADAADEDCFSEAESSAFEAAMTAVQEEAMAILAETQELADINVEDFLAETERRWAANPVRHALKQRSVARRERTNAKMAQWRAVIQGRLLALAEALAAREADRQPA